MRGVPPQEETRPRILPTRAVVPVSDWPAKPPTARIARGRTAAIWPSEKRRARGDLVGLRVAVPRRPALDDVADVDGLLPREVDRLEQEVEEPSGTAHERQSRPVLVRAGRLPDHHHLRLRVAVREDHLAAGLRKPAARAGGRDLLELGERGREGDGGRRRCAGFRWRLRALTARRSTGVLWTRGGCLAASLRGTLAGHAGALQRVGPGQVLEDPRPCPELGPLADVPREVGRVRTAAHGRRFHAATATARSTSSPANASFDWSGSGSGSRSL